MKIIFYSQDAQYREFAERLKDVDWSYCEELDEVLYEYDQQLQEDEGPWVYLLDFSLPQKLLDKFSKKVFKNPDAVRIGLCDADSIKEVRKHQKTKLACHAYLIKPADEKAIESAINDYLIALGYEQIQEEGDPEPWGPIRLEMLTHEELSQLDDEKEYYDTTQSSIVIPEEMRNCQRTVIEGTGEDSEELSAIEDDDEDEDVFPVQEMRMDNTVKDTIALHSMGSDYDFSQDKVCQKIQEKFDHVFQDTMERLSEDDTGPGLSFDGGAPEEEEPTPEVSISFDGADGEQEEQVLAVDSSETDMGTKKDDTSDGLDFSLPDDDQELDLSGNEPAEQTDEVLDLGDDEEEGLKFEGTGDHDLPEAEALDFDLGDIDSPAQATSESASDESEGLDFSIDSDAGEEIEGLERSSAPTGGEEAEEDFSFDLGGEDSTGEVEGLEAASAEESVEDGFGELEVGDDEDDDVAATVVASIDPSSFSGGDSTSDNLEKTISEIVQGPVHAPAGDDFLEETGDIELGDEFNFTDEELQAGQEELSDSDKTAQTVIAQAPKPEEMVEEFSVETPKPEAPTSSGTGEFDLAAMIEEDDETTDNFALDDTGDAEDVTRVAQVPSPQQMSAPTSVSEPPISRPMSSYSDDELLRLQGTIKQLREERDEHIKQIHELKRDLKLSESDHIGIKAELDETKIEISILKKRHQQEVEELKYQLGLANEKKQIYEERCKNYQKEFDRLNQKVRLEFNQVKQREKELESQLELVTMDSEAQVQARDNKILELKRKIDALEFNMENATIREEKSREDRVRVEEKMAKIMSTLRGSIKLLEDDLDIDEELKTRLKEGRDKT